MKPRQKSMAYYRILGFYKEPFSNTPDPRILYHSRQHLEILQKLEISIHLKRGLNLIMGDVGAGKTTLSRQLIRKTRDDKKVDIHLILDPGFDSTGDFLSHLHQLLTGRIMEKPKNETQLKEKIKTHLFSKFVDKNIITVLLIDEGQKASLPILEVLRELLNFETNNEKLLQIIIFAQNEFATLLEEIENFKDRISFQYNLRSLGFKESKSLIQYRLNQSFAPGKARPFFTGLAYRAIYSSTKGSPRKMVTLCHQIILAMIIQKKKKAGYVLVRSCINKSTVANNDKPAILLRRFVFWGLIIAALILLFIAGQNYEPKRQISSAMPETATLTIIKKIYEKPLHPVASPSEPILVLPSTTVTSIKEFKKPHAETPPLEYGKATVPPDATVSKMIRRVYGLFSDELLLQFIARNPIIQSPDHILPGMDLFFPISKLAKPMPETGFFPLFLQTRQFSQAFSKAMSKEFTKEVPVRILARPLANSNFFFHVILDHSFSTQSQGLAFMKKKYPNFPLNFYNMVSLDFEQNTTKGRAL